MRGMAKMSLVFASTSVRAWECTLYQEDVDAYKSASASYSAVVKSNILSEDTPELEVARVQSRATSAKVRRDFATVKESYGVTKEEFATKCHLEESMLRTRI